MFEMIDIFLGNIQFKTLSMQFIRTVKQMLLKIKSPGERQKITRLIGIPIQAGIFEDCTSEFRAKLALKYEQR